MKKFSTLCLLLSLFAILPALIAATSSTDQQTTTFPGTPNPEIPESVTFAGQDISLDRVDMYERFDRELTAMTYTHGTTLLTIKRANRYFPMLMPILKKNGIPSDLIYLACIESNLNIRAYSGAKAAGMWQFIQSTAEIHGLEVNDYVDERFDPERSTEAACKFLKEAYNRYRNWESVAAAYNGGNRRITNALDNQKQTSAYDLHLADETSRYMFRLLAMKLILENPSDYGFAIRADQLYNPVNYTEVQVDTAVVSWVDWAEQQGMTFAQLREHNPWIRASSLPNKSGKTYRVRIPDPKDLNRSTARHKVYDQRWVID